MKKLLVRILFVGLAFLSFTGCLKEEKQMYIAAILKNGDVEYWQQIESAIANQALSMGFGYILSTVEDDGDIEGQTDALESIRKDFGDQIAGLIIAPIYTEDNHRFEEAVADFVTEKNINLVIIDSPVDKEKSPVKDLAICYVGTDNAKAGELLASNIETPASEILAASLSSSSPAWIRSDAFHKAKGETAEWITTEDKVEAQIDSVIAANPASNDYVFFNGSMCTQVLDKLDGKNVYSFDAYKPMLESLLNDGSVKGVLAQDTFSMGATAALAVITGSSSDEIFIKPVYISRETIKNGNGVNFFNYYGLTN